MPPGDATKPARQPTPALAASGEPPGTLRLLAAAVAGIGGSERTGQNAMAVAVEAAIGSDEHLAVQAGTGTGKSLAYLVPAVAHAAGAGAHVVVATATIALQRQLIERDLPRLAQSLEPLLGRAPTFAILKGRRNYLCLHRLRTGPPDEPGQTLFDPAGTSAVGQQVRRITEWSATTSTGDRDELVPGVDDRAWRQVSVSAAECMGALRCPFGQPCYAERARAAAGEVDIVVTNHALLAIDALDEVGVLPEHEVVIIDEAHDLVSRVTSAASAELSAAAVETAARRGTRMAADEAARLREAGQALDQVLAATPGGRIDELGEPLAAALAAVRDALSACASAVRASSGDTFGHTELAASKAALATLDELGTAASRMLAAFGSDIANRGDVVWLDAPEGEDARQPPTLRVAPLEVAGLLAERLFGRRTVVLTSATLALGGSFEPLARQWGLPVPAEGRWTGLDVGSPFDHKRSAILYVAAHLPPPGRDGLPEAYLTELGELIEAAGGRTLGLFSSMRAARQAAQRLREVVTFPVLCQGEDATGELIRRFAADEATCLFGTLSLWQGVDVPGRALQLVVIDRIPFPRPDDPLASARSRAVAARGGNGFMEVAATHAALLLAQGSGRLLRTMDDRGVVAILDPRLLTARYGGFLRASLAPFWPTTDPAIVRAALRRLAARPG